MTGAVVQKNVLAEFKYASRLTVWSSFNRTAFTLSWNDNSQAYNFNTCTQRILVFQLSTCFCVLF